MEKRSEKRHMLGFKCELLYGGKSYFGSVENISENGLNMIAYPLNRAIDFNVGTELEMKFQFLSGEAVNLRCAVKWSYKTSPHDFMFSIGTKIIESSPEYKEFLKSLITKTRKARVMIFDDEENFLNNLKRWFSHKDYEVFTFNNPIVCSIYEERIDQCIKENPCADIIITDLNMPEMNGIELLQYQSRRGCKIEIRNKAIISGYIDDENRKAIENLGCSFFLKPLELSLISDWLNTCEKRIDLSLPLDTI